MRAIRAVLDYLASGGVRYVFGIPAGSVNAFFDELVQTPWIRPIITKHEGAAAYMAAAYARATNQLAVCIGSSGPGSTNLLSGAANAMREQVPVLFLTGYVPVTTMGLNASQELDSAPIYEPVTKYSTTVLHAEELLPEIAKAVTIALTGVPGPVHVAMPINVQLAQVEPPTLPAFPNTEPIHPQDGVLNEAAMRLAHSDSGVVFVGQGARNAIPEVVQVAELLGWPIVVTPQAKGLIPDHHPLLLGIYGFAGHPRVSEFMENGNGSTLLIVGSSLGETATSNYNQRLTEGRFVIHLDINPKVFGRVYPTNLGIQGDAKVSLRSLYEKLRSSHVKPQEFTRAPAEWLPSDGQFNTSNVLTALQQMLPENTRYTVDIGEHMSYVIHHMRVLHENSFEINVHFGPMGIGISSAIGVQLANPETPVACITGDGCFFMHGAELLTAKEYHLPILFIVINNSRLGMVHHGHMLQYHRAHACFSQQPIRIAEVAAAYGVPNRRIERLDELTADAVLPLCTGDGPSLLEIALVDESTPPMGDRVKFLSSFGESALPVR